MIILQVLRAAIVATVGPLAAVYLTGTAFSLPIAELALIGIKALATNGGPLFEIGLLAWLTGTAMWNHARLAETIKKQMEPQKTSCKSFLTIVPLVTDRSTDTDARPLGVYDAAIFDENSKYFTLMNFDPSPAPSPVAGKELIVVAQPYEDFDVCYPGEVGFWDAELAAVFEHEQAVAHVALLEQAKAAGLMRAYDALQSVPPYTISRSAEIAAPTATFSATVAAANPTPTRTSISYSAAATAAPVTAVPIATTTFISVILAAAPTCPAVVVEPAISIGRVAHAAQLNLSYLTWPIDYGFCDGASDPVPVSSSLPFVSHYYSI